MDIYPQELGPGYCTKVLQWRGLVKGVKVRNAPALETEGYDFLGAVLGAAAGSGVGLFCFFHALTFFGTMVVAATGAAIGCGCGVLTDRRNRGKVRVRAVTAVEVAHVSESEPDELRRDYLGALTAAVALPVSRDQAAGQNIHRALCSIGESLDKLPSDPGGAMPAAPDALRAGAAQLARKALDDPDPVVAASLERQADALRLQAETTARTAALARRNRVLRDEVAAQVRAFRASLAAAQVNSASAGGDFAALAGSVAQVAQEANALADARAELEAALAPTPLRPEAAPLRVGQSG